MKNRRDFLRNTLGLGAGLAAAPRLFATSNESRTGMDMKQLSHATERSSGESFLSKRPTFRNFRGAWKGARKSST